ncbi:MULTISPECIES: TetR/AcrR family transcriptional regulator [unclassified Gordonia (in: high G+C Gram-positive bacteria)]|uniref:TetR/AcrR family transcriptional regulator n=1 Tax=unclassified Gordonia (in: high G+C Gram-positive bacteria) TaxID=2657482 RepID=UPI0009AC9518|nr:MULTISPECIES: TetR/AcrR family transcriptional regulator [unclassified Gordonia (in: high G+C Gram-positive bacteria)]MDF3282989.1 TetR/AcrR family transcriptional regulator [Gordonia sp. N1V]OPX10776.1 hypothetical protein B1964_23285 [Gordonia sp. i37]
MNARGTTYHQVLDAAEQLFGDRGYSEVSIVAICEASGVPVGSIYHHFKNKAGILRAVLERGVGDFFDALPRPDDLTGSARERMNAHYTTSADLIVANLSLFRLIASVQLHSTPADTELQQLLRQISDGGSEIMAQFIESVAIELGIDDAAHYARKIAPLNLVFLNGMVITAGSVDIDIHTGIRVYLQNFILSSILAHAQAQALMSSH